MMPVRGARRGCRGWFYLGKRVRLRQRAATEKAGEDGGEADEERAVEYDFETGNQMARGRWKDGTTDDAGALIGGHGGVSCKPCAKAEGVTS